MTLRATLALFLLAPFAFAELSVRFLAERLPEDLEEVAMFADEVASESFELPTIHLSPSLAPPARAFELRTSADRRLLGRVALPDAGDSFIVLLLPDPEGGYRSVVLRADAPGFRPGDSYLHNHTDRGIVGYIGTSRFRLEPGSGRFVRPGGRAEEGFHQVGFGVEGDAGTRALSMTRWPVDSNLRSYVFFFRNSRTQRVDYRAVDEFIPTEKPGE